MWRGGIEGRASFSHRCREDCLADVEDEGVKESGIGVWRIRRCGALYGGSDGIDVLVGDSSALERAIDDILDSSAL